MFCLVWGWKGGAGSFLSAVGEHGIGKCVTLGEGELFFSYFGEECEVASWRLS